MSVSQVTTHILDTGSGRPAAGVAVVLYVRDGDDLEGAYVALATVLSAVVPACVGTIDVAVPATPVLTGVPGCQ